MSMHIFWKCDRCQQPCQLITHGRMPTDCVKASQSIIKLKPEWYHVRELVW